MTVLLTVLALTGTPTTTGDRADCPPHLERTYTRAYRRVARRHGPRAPGRNIRRDGVRFHGHTFDPVCSELRRARSQLERLLSPPTYPTLTRTAIAPRRPPAGVKTSSVTAGPTLQAIAACESGGNYTTNTGNGYYGAFQFDLQTWQSVGGYGLPSNASVAEQNLRAAILYAQRGAAPWPICGYR